MIAYAAFEHAVETDDRRVQALHFAARSERFDDLDGLSATAASRLSKLFECELAVEIDGPSATPQFDTSGKVAQLLHFAGLRRDAYVVLGAPSALRLAAWAFGEDGAVGDRTLSPVERRTCDRFLGEFARVLLPLCGDIAHVERATLDHALRATSWLSFRFTLGAASCALAVGLGAPARKGAQALTARQLLDTAIEVRARLAATALSARAVLDLRVGDLVPFAIPLDAPVRLCAGDATLAVGQCGFAADGIAFLVTTSLEEISR